MITRSRHCAFLVLFSFLISISYAGTGNYITIINNSGGYLLKISGFSTAPNGLGNMNSIPSTDYYLKNNESVVVYAEDNDTSFDGPTSGGFKFDLTLLTGIGLPAGFGGVVFLWDQSNNPSFPYTYSKDNSQLTYDEINTESLIHCNDHWWEFIIPGSGFGTLLTTPNPGINISGTSSINDDCTMTSNAYGTVYETLTIN